MKRLILVVFLLVVFNPIYILEGSKTKYIQTHSKVDPDAIMRTIRSGIRNTQLVKDNIEFDGSKLDAEAAILGLIYIESTFKADAVNLKSGCSGLLQIEKATYMNMIKSGMITVNNWANINDPYYNILIGILWFDYTYKLVKKSLPKLSKAEVFKVAIAAYNKGVSVTVKEVRSSGGIPPKYRYVERFRWAYRNVKKMS